MEILRTYQNLAYFGERLQGPRTETLPVSQMPNDDDLLLVQPVTFQNNANVNLATRKNELDTPVANGDWETILTKGPARESSA